MDKIVKVDSLTYLGLKIDKNLNWHYRVDSTKSKIVSIIGALRRAKNILPRSVQIKIYFAHIYSRIKFLLLIWSTAADYKMQTLRVLQNKALTTIFNKPRLTESLTLYSVQFLPLNTLIIFDQIMFIYNLKHKHIRHSIDLRFNTEMHRYKTVVFFQ